MFKIGVILESLRCGLEGGLRAAAELKVDGIQFYASAGETHYTKLQGSRGRDLKHRLEDTDLTLAAICGDFGGHGLANASENTQRLQDIKRVIELASALSCQVVTTHIGVIPDDTACSRYNILHAACTELGSFATKHGVTLAVETGPEPASVLRNFLDALGAESGVGVNFDPANLVMVCRSDIPSAVATLAPYIVHTHAKDGRNLQTVDPDILYAVFAGDPAPSGFRVGDHIQETPLGEGDVHFPEDRAALKSNGFTDGFLTIERETGENPLREITNAVGFLRSFST